MTLSYFVDINCWIYNKTRKPYLNVQYTTNHTPSSHNMLVINMLCAKFMSINTSLRLPSFVKNAKWQLTWVKRCRSRPPSFLPGQPTCQGMVHSKQKQEIFFFAKHSDQIWSSPSPPLSRCWEPFLWKLNGWDVKLTISLCCWG